jgi:signal transduction histidine kinase
MNDLFIKLLSQLRDGIVIFDLSGKVTFSNLEKSRFEGIVVDNQIVDNTVMKEAAEIHKSKTNEVKDIKLKMIEQIENDNHTVIFQNENMFCLHIKDELDRASYKALRDNMFSLINHELRTPMGHLASVASFISDTLKVNKGEIIDKDEFQYFLKVTTESVAEVTTKMERLLELAYTYGSEPMRNKKRMQLIDVVNSAIDSLKKESLDKNTIVKVEQKCDVIGNLYGSFGWLKRAIEECIRNSIEHSHHGGEILLHIEQKKYFANVTIRNFGLGISPKVTNTLFEPFVGSGDKDDYSNQGLGIGLSLARNIVEDHGGNIKHIQHDDGVEFYIELPTGGIKISKTDLDIRQSQLYASDLALLLKKEADR